MSLSVRFALSLTLLCGARLQAQDTPPAPPAKEGASQEDEAPVRVTSPAGLVLTGQKGWVHEKPTSTMRVAQWKLPHAEGDEKDAEVAVFWFQGGGGGVDANIERWVGQLKQPDGKPSKEVMKRETKEIAGFKVHLVDVTGTYSAADMRPGAGGAKVEIEGARLLGAIVEGPGGPHFVKLLGPKATVDKWEKSFTAFLEGLRQEG